MQLANSHEFTVGRVKDAILSPFSRYYRGKYTISKAGPETQAVFPFVTVSRDAQIALIKNSKSGCTSLAKAIYTYDTGKNFSGNIHRSGAHLAQGYSHWKSNFDHVMSNDALNISAVRNPADRIVSAFFDFIVEERNPIRLQYRQVFDDFDLLEETDNSQRFNRFLDFVETSLSIDPWRTDRHWRLQTHNLWVEKISYDILLRTDALDTGFARLRSALNISNERLPLFHVNKRDKNHGFALSAGQKNRIDTIYTKDFDLFESTAT